MGSSHSAICSKNGHVSDELRTISRTRSASAASVAEPDPPIIRRRITIHGDLIISKSHGISINLHELDLHQIMSQIDIAHNLQIGYENQGLPTQPTGHMMELRPTTMITSADA